MNIGTKTKPNQIWKELYQAALFEIDKEKRSQRIDEARMALLLRARQLFYSDPEHFEERQAVIATMYALNAFHLAIEAAEERTRTQSPHTTRPAQGGGKARMQIS